MRMRRQDGRRGGSGSVEGFGMSKMVKVSDRKSVSVHYL